MSGPASGQGKTTVTAGLARLYARAGKKVRVFKCGQDFIDPAWLALASGAPVHQLDPWLVGEAECRRRLWQAAGQSDLLLIEGVMGLFDGYPSTADMAITFSLPVLAVIDAWAMAETFGAISFGLEHYRPEISWRGVVANRVAGKAHADMLRRSLSDPDHWLGALPNDRRLCIPERHLGLTLASTREESMAILDCAADALALSGFCPLPTVEPVLRSVRFTGPATAESTPPLLSGCTVAVARDAAFCFVYDANIVTLQELGATVIFTSPLHDAQLPECDALWLPGGYPELHAECLSANLSFRESVRRHAACNRPIWAECGGMMCLFESLHTIDSRSWPMWGVLPGTTRMQDNVAALGPHTLQLEAGTLRGHTYHHSRCETSLVPQRFTKRATGAGEGRGEALFAVDNTRGSYFHAYFSSSMHATAALFQGMKVT